MSIKSPTGFDAHGVWVLNSKSFSIIGNIIKDCKGSGIITEGSMDNASDFIINNLVYNCGEDGIKSGNPLPVSNSKTYIYNNTTYSCKRGIHFINSSSGESVAGDAVNNICQKSTYRDYVVDSFLPTSSFILDNCTSEDESAGIYSGSLNDKNTLINFISVSNGNFNLGKKDYSALDTGIDLSEISSYNFIDDIALKPREPGFWDRGAFETIEIFGSGDLLVSPVRISREGASQSAETPTLIIHLRLNSDNDLPDVDHQFYSISEINDYLALSTIWNSYNLIIYTQGGQSFDGTFSFGDRGTVRTVLVQTYPQEAHLGPTYLKGIGGILISEDSIQKEVKFYGVKVGCATEVYDYIISPTALTRKIIFVNSIVGVEKDSIVSMDNGFYCAVHVINSYIIYENNDLVPGLFLSKNNTGNFIANSVLITYTPLDNITFNTTDDVANDDRVVNVLTYNFYDFSGSTFNILNIRKTKCLEQINPQIDNMELTSFPIDGEYLVSLDLVPLKTSPLIDTGDIKSVAGITTDIIGNARIYSSGVVDIGPYEMQIHRFTFQANNISAIYQDKLFLDYASMSYIGYETNVKMRDLYNQFFDNPLYVEEFSRESKIIITIKQIESDYIFKTDKKNILVKEFEAYYDDSTSSIIVTKTNYLLGELFNNIFEDSRYIFEFDEVAHKLIVYLSDTFKKGVSGDKNPVKNIKSGGTSLITN